MAESSASSLLMQNTNVKNENSEKFPYKILNDLAKKLKAAEDQIIRERNLYENKIAFMLEIESSRDALKDDVVKLKQRISDLVFENNRYHLSISYCTVCTSDDEFSDASLSDVSITASTPVSFGLPSSDPASLSSTTPSLMPGSEGKEKQADAVMKRKDKTFINRMAKTLAKLEAKYLIPEHKRKKRLFIRKEKASPIVPKEFDTIFHVLAAPEPEPVSVSEPFPHVRWSDVRFKPALPAPERCPVYSCSPDPAFYVEKSSPLYNGTDNFGSLARQYGQSFGTLPGYKTNLGVVAVPTTPVGGYVYCPDAKKWVLYAEPRSSPSSAGRGTRRGGAMSLTRRRRSKE